MNTSGFDVLRATINQAAANGGHGLTPARQIELLNHLQAAEDRLARVEALAASWKTPAHDVLCGTYFGVTSKDRVAAELEAALGVRT